MTRVIKPTFLAPMTAPGTIEQTGICAIQLRNGGTATVVLGGNAYTLDPGETLSLNVTEENSLLNATGIQVAFDTSTGTGQLLQIIILKITDC